MSHNGVVAVKVFFAPYYDNSAEINLSYELSAIEGGFRSVKQALESMGVNVISFS